MILEEILCLPLYCIYAYTCVERPHRQRTVSIFRCYRYRPRGERPVPRLSEFAWQRLQIIRQELYPPKNLDSSPNGGGRPHN